MHFLKDDAMKRPPQLSLYICLLVMVLLAAVLPSLAVPVPAEAAALGDAAPKSPHTMSMDETSLPSILTVSFAILILYTAYRYWTDNHGKHRTE
jgi:hypothetical protein